MSSVSESQSVTVNTRHTTFRHNIKYLLTAPEEENKLRDAYIRDDIKCSL